MISKRQLLALFGCNLLAWIVAQGTIALLPVYAVRLGADPAMNGLFLSFSFLAVTLGTVATGWFSHRFQRRKEMIIVAGLLNIPASWLMGQVTAFWQLAVLTAFVWFFIGVSFTTVVILVGMFAGESERGKIFGVLAMNTGIGAVIGGAGSGPIVDRWGYSGLFLVAALFWAVVPLIALFVQDKTVARTPRINGSNILTGVSFGEGFWLLLLANVLAFGAGFIASLGRPLIMDKLGFDAAAISGAVAIGGAVTLPCPPLFGWLSDRIGRYLLIEISFLLGAAGLIAMVVSVSLWQFWIASILLAGPGLCLGIGSALVADMVPAESMGSALAWLGLSPSTGGIIGFALSGYAIQAFGTSASFIFGAILTVIAVVVVTQIHRARQLALT